MQLIQKQFNDSIVTFDLSSDMMVSLTDMAKANNKFVGDWLRLQSTQDYLNEYCSDMGITISEQNNILQVRKGNISTGEQQGTWANQDIALYFAQWLSPKFHVWCNKQIKELLTTGKVELKPKTPLELAHEALLVTTAELTRLETVNQQLTTKIAQDAPLVNFGNAIATASDNILIGDLAKLSGKIGRNNLFKMLRDKNILCKDNTPRQQYIDAGYFEVFERVVKSVKGDLISITTQVTGSGQIWLLNKIEQFLESK